MAWIGERTHGREMSALVIAAAALRYAAIALFVPPGARG
jgi:hypothetical protein